MSKLDGIFTFGAVLADKAKRRELSPHEKNRYLSPEHRDGLMSDEDVIAAKREIMKAWAEELGMTVVDLPLSESPDSDTTVPKDEPRIYTREGTTKMSFPHKQWCPALKDEACLCWDEEMGEYFDSPEHQERYEARMSELEKISPEQLEEFILAANQIKAEFVKEVVTVRKPSMDEWTKEYGDTTVPAPCPDTDQK